MMGKMRSFGLFLLSLCISSILLGQDLQLIKTIKLPGVPTAYSIDIQQNLYFGFEDGTVVKYDSEGNEKLNYSLPNQSAVTLIEAQNALKTFLYYFDTQQIITLDRFNTVPKIYDLHTYDITLALQACPSPDENFWVIENNPTRIKKVDPLRSATVLEVQTNVGDTVRFMRTYKNLLLILTQKDLQIFDLFGSRINEIDRIDAQYFQIVNDQVILASSDQLITLDPFNGTITEEEELPVKNTSVFLRTKYYSFYLVEDSLFMYK